MTLNQLLFRLGSLAEDLTRIKNSLDELIGWVLEHKKVPPIEDDVYEKGVRMERSEKSLNKSVKRGIR